MMSFFNEALSAIGSVSRYLNQQGAPQTAVVAPTAQAASAPSSVTIDKEAFMSMFKEAMKEYDDEKSSETAEELVSEKDSNQPKLDMSGLFNYLDANKDGILSKDEYGKLEYLFELMNISK